MVSLFSRRHGRLAWRPLPLRVLMASTAAAVAASLGLAAALAVPTDTGADLLDAAAAGLSSIIMGASCAVLVVSLAIAAASGVAALRATDARRVRWQVCERLYSATRGNPLRLKDGDELPRVECRRDGGGFSVTVYTDSGDAESVSDIGSCISAALHGRFESFAVVSFEQDVAGKFVRFAVSDVSSDKSLRFSSVDEMRPECPTRLVVQDGLYLDLTVARSLLVAGKTRAGKTTGVISLLIQVLLLGADDYGSKVVLVDPKSAELSQCGAVTLDEDGGAHSILGEVRDFDRLRRERQDHLNELSRECGNAVMWWDAGMRPCYLFIDEYVALCSVLPKRRDKDDPGYSLDDFEGLVRTIATMGASAGCFLIISVAQASVGSGGISTVVLNACGTHVLFRPTVDDGAFIWPRPLLDALPARRYAPGDAWFSCDDGEHANPMFVRFPRMDFQVYAELKRLLDDYRS